MYFGIMGRVLALPLLVGLRIQYVIHLQEQQLHISLVSP